MVTVPPRPVGGLLVLASLWLTFSAPQGIVTADGPAPPRVQTFDYKRSGGESRQIEIHFPPDHDPSRDRVPAILFFHGGGWQSGNLSQFRVACEYFASRGLVAATANYQMLDRQQAAALDPGVSRKRVCVTDAKSAIRWLKGGAERFGIDPDRLAVGGGSAGGHLAVLASRGEGLDDPREPPDVDTSVVAYVLFNPAFSPDDHRDPAVDATRWADADFPPALVFFGTDDRNWKPGWVAFQGRLRESGNRSTELLWAAGQGHGFFNRSPWRERTLAAADRFLTTQGLLQGSPTIDVEPGSAELVSIVPASGDVIRESADGSRSEGDVGSDEGFRLRLRSQRRRSVSEDGYETVIRDESWRADETALIVCDVWDAHHCLNAVRRLEQFAPRLNDLVAEVRRRGGTIIHAPSDCMAAYEGHPARERARQTPLASELPPEINQWCSQIPSEEQAVYPLDQSDGGEDDDPEEHAEWAERLRLLGRDPRRPWLRQAEAIRIDRDRDFISDRGEEIWSILEGRGIRNVILAGVHVNMCVLGRPFGLRQMVRNGKHAVLMRDLTDSMYNPARFPYVSHLTGNDLIVTHIERYVCPTVSSDQILGGEPFRFAEPRPAASAADPADPDAGLRGTAFPR